MRTTGLRYALSLVICPTFVLAVVATPVLGFHFENGQGNLPILKLPYQSYQATNYSAATDVSLAERIDLKILH
jgi:hypothetical protein